MNFLYETFLNLIDLVNAEKFASALKTLILKEGSTNTNLLSNRKLTLPEIELGRLVLPREVNRELQKLGLQGLYISSTLLRCLATQHQANWLWSRLNICERGSEPFLPLKGFFPKNIEPDFGIGFSPLGFHPIFRDIGRCAAFDLYDCQHCDRTTNSLFCDLHTQDYVWWQETPAKDKNVQTQMFSYYSSSQVIEDFRLDEIEDLVNAFLNKVIRAPSQQNIARSLKYFGLESLDECLQLGGSTWLKGRYRQLAKQIHPDTGGSHDEFCILKENYLTLLRMI